MKSNPRPVEFRRLGRAARQAGVATLLIVVLTGLALATLVFGAFGAISALQARSLTLHAATQAQLQAWNGVEGVRQYLGQLGSTGALALANGTVLTFANSAMSAKVSAAPSAGTGTCPATATQVPVTVTNDANAAGPARVSVDSVICVTPAVAGYPGLVGNSSNIKGTLKISGLVTMKPDSVGSDKLVVDGDITSNGGGGTMTGFTTLNSTGNIDISASANNIDFVQANGYIKIQGTFTSLTAIGDITTTGGSTTASTVTSRGAVTITSGPSGCCSPPTKPAASYDVIQAVGDVKFSQSVPVNTVLTEGSIVTVSNNVTYIMSSAQAEKNYTEGGCCSTVVSGKYGGTLTQAGGHSGNQILNLTKDATLNVTVPAVTPVSAATPKVDAYYYKSSANYVFDFDPTYTPTVTVNNVNGLTSGTTYYLVGDGGSKRDYLCTSKTYSAANCPKKLCYGYSASNSCFSITGNATTSSWSLTSTSGSTAAVTTLAPGVAWFKGDLTLNSGYYVNTFIATGNITITNASMYVVDPAWAGTAGTCTNPVFGTMYPSNLCVSGVYQDSALANVALMSGSTSNGTFSGGDINIGTGNKIYGNVIAGDTLNTSGSTTIYGVFSAQLQSGSGTATNSFGASTTFDQTNLKVFPGTGSGAGAGTAASTTVMWSRYR